MTTSTTPIADFDNFARLRVCVAKVQSAELLTDLRSPCRRIVLDIGQTETITSIGQYALIPESELVGTLVIAITNFAPRKMGKYISAALVLGTSHPESPEKQHQAIPLRPSVGAKPGDEVF